MTLFTELAKHPLTSFYIPHFLDPFFYYCMSQRFYTSIIFSVIWEVIEIIIFLTLGNYSALFLELEETSVESNIDIVLLDIGGALLSVSLAFMYFKNNKIVAKPLIEENVLTCGIAPFQDNNVKVKSFRESFTCTKDVSLQWGFLLKILVSLPLSSSSCGIIPDIIQDFEAAQYLFPALLFLVNLIFYYIVFYKDNFEHKWFILIIILLTHSTVFSCLIDYPPAVTCLYLYFILVVVYYIFRYISYLMYGTNNMGSKNYKTVNYF